MSTNAMDYMTTERCNARLGNNTIYVPEGMFLKPVSPRYLPAHIVESSVIRFYNPDTEIIAYCHFGIIAIGMEFIRKANYEKS